MSNQNNKDNMGVHCKYFWQYNIVIDQIASRCDRSFRSDGQ